MWLYSIVYGNPASNRELVEFAGVGPGDRVLDIGCGPGASLEAAHSAGAEVFGVDPSPGMVQRAGARVPDATVREGSAESLPFDEGRFTHVWTISAFHHWAHPQSGVAEVRRVLADDGRFLVVERKLKADKTGHGLSVGDAERVREDLETAGFSNCRVDPIRVKRSEYLVVSTSRPARA